MFLIHTVQDGHIPAFEYLPASSGLQPKLGMALTLASGKLDEATGTTKPKYISMLESTATVSEGSIVPVIRVTPDITFETVSSAAMTSINAGDLVTIASDSLRVTATKTSGVATVREILDTAEGGKVRVTFD